MKVLLIKDVPKLGRAGDVKKVANGYGRNYLIPQQLAVLATPGAVKQASRIRAQADVLRQALNSELSGVAQRLDGVRIAFAVRASDTGRLYGSVTTRMVADSLNEQYQVEVNHRQVESQPLRNLGVYEIPIQLTMDLAPVVTVVVHREGETPEAMIAAEEAAEAEAAEAEAAEAAAEAEAAEAEETDEAAAE